MMTTCHSLQMVRSLILEFIERRANANHANYAQPPQPSDFIRTSHEPPAHAASHGRLPPQRSAPHQGPQKRGPRAGHGSDGFAAETFGPPQHYGWEPPVGGPMGGLMGGSFNSFAGGGAGMMGMGFAAGTIPLEMLKNGAMYMPPGAPQEMGWQGAYAPPPVHRKVFEKGRGGKGKGRGGRATGGRGEGGRGQGA